MSQTGYTPILSYASGTASAVPSASNLTSSASGAELAVNYADGKLFYKDSGGVVQVMASKATGSIGGATTQVQFNNAGALGGSASLTWNGTVLTSSGFAGPLNGTVGATTPSTGAFTTLSASSTVSGTGFSTYLASPPAIGGTAAAAGSFTTLNSTGGALNGSIGATTASTGAFTTTTVSTSETLSYGTANGVAYLNGSKVLTSGSALTFDGSQLAVNAAAGGINMVVSSSGNTGSRIVGGTGAGLGAYLSLQAQGTNAFLIGTESSVSGGTSNNLMFYGYGSNSIIFAPATTESMRLTSSLLSVVPGATIQGLTVGRGAGAVATNTAVGSSALATNTTGNYSAAFGDRALTQNTTGATNAAVGSLALYSNTTGSNNASLGYSALYGNTTGGANTAVGREALQANTTASNNTAVGYQAGYTNSTNGGLTAIGYQAAYTTTAENVTALGYLTLKSNTTGAENTAGGVTALYSNTTGSYNTAWGRDALRNNTTANNNTAVGYQAAYTNTTGDLLSAVGRYALYSNTTGTQNSAVGQSALYSNTTGNYNNAFGSGALQVNSTGSNNTAIGQQALYFNTTASNNTAVGYQAGYTMTLGSANTFIGYQAGYNAASGGSQNTLNTFIGYQSGVSMTTGLKNSILGSFSGNQGGLDIRTANNYIVLSDGDGNPRGVFDGSGNFLVGTSTPQAKLTVINGSNTNRALYVEGYPSGLPTSSFYRDNTDAQYAITVRHDNAVSTSTGYMIQFLNQGGTGVGSITSTGTGTAYNIISDQRLKENIVDAPSASGDIDAIQVRSFDFISDKSSVKYGFIAQELVKVAPQAVHQPADPEEMMAVDYSKLVPMLVKEIQSLRKRLAALEAK